MLEVVAAVYIRRRMWISNIAADVTSLEVRQTEAEKRIRLNALDASSSGVWQAPTTEVQILGQEGSFFYLPLGQSLVENISEYFLGSLIL